MCFGGGVSRSGACEWGCRKKRKGDGLAIKKGGGGVYLRCGHSLVAL